jgi:hypothetical protein
MGQVRKGPLSVPSYVLTGAVSLTPKRATREAERADREWRGSLPCFPLEAKPSVRPHALTLDVSLSREVLT